jgi:hypothetical protein
MKEDLKSAARVTLINPLVTLDPVLAFGYAHPEWTTAPVRR